MNKSAEETKRKSILNGIVPLPADEQTEYTPETCANKNNFALLMDYFDGAVTLDSMLNNNNILLDEDKAKILFQIYAPLYALGEETFQHKDLHTRNIMVKTLESEVTFTYLFDDENIVESDGTTKVKEKSFKTKYLAKMIDYGRCYIPSTQEYLDQYHSLEPNKQKDLEYMLNECGIVHVLFGNTDLRLYNMLFPGDKQITSIEMVLNSLISIISPAAQRKGGSTKKTKSNRKKNPKKKTRTRKMKGGDGDNTLTIDCRKYIQTNPSEVVDEQSSKRQKTSHNSNTPPLPLPPPTSLTSSSSSDPSPPPTREPMKYNGNITYLNDMISTSGNEVQDLNEQLFNVASQNSLP